MSIQSKPRPKPELPAAHPQWAKLDLAELLALPTAYLIIGLNNNTLASDGSQAHERLWERARLPGGEIGNTIKLVHACREADNRVVWSRRTHDRVFGEHYPRSPMDKVQYEYWASRHPDWTEEQKRNDWLPAKDVAALARPEDLEVRYDTIGNIFVGTMLPSYLNMWGIRTLLLSGYHLDWCVEQAARTCRDLGYMPIVVGDASGCGIEADEAPTLSRLERFFAPVVSTDRAIELVREGAARRAAR